MPSLLRLTRLILPAAFFGYGAYANLAVLTGGEAAAPGATTALDGSIVTGEVSASLGATYTRAMPHREPAVAWIGAGRYLLAGEGRAGVVVGRDGWLFTEEELEAATDDQLAFMVDEAEAARDRLAAMGTALVVVPLPAKLDLYRDHATAPRAAAAMEAQYERFLAALGAAGVPAVDARAALAAAAAEEQVFLTRDTHWTPAGAAVVARAVADSGLVPAGTDAFDRREDPALDVTGDLVSFVTADWLAPAIGLAPEPVTPYVAEAASGLAGGLFAADAAPFDVVLVGTSYSADERWSFAPALTLALGRDVLNRAAVGQGPVRPLRALLDDPALAAEPPEVVIWEVPVRYLADPLLEPAPAAGGPESM